MSATLTALTDLPCLLLQSAHPSVYILLCVNITVCRITLHVRHFYYCMYTCARHHTFLSVQIAQQKHAEGTSMGSTEALHRRRDIAYLQLEDIAVCFNCWARVLFCNRLSSTQFINTSNPLTHHRSMQTATNLKKVHTFLKIFSLLLVFWPRIIFPVFTRAEKNWAIWMEMKSMKLGEKLSGRHFTFPLAFSQPQSALYGNTWIYIAIQFCCVKTNNVALLDV